MEVAREDIFMGTMTSAVSARSDHTGEKMRKFTSTGDMARQWEDHHEATGDYVNDHSLMYGGGRGRHTICHHAEDDYREESLDASCAQHDLVPGHSHLLSCGCKLDYSRIVGYRYALESFVVVPSNQRRRPENSKERTQGFSKVPQSNDSNLSKERDELKIGNGKDKDKKTVRATTGLGNENKRFPRPARHDSNKTGQPPSYPLAPPNLQRSNSPKIKPPRVHRRLGQRQSMRRIPNVAFSGPIDVRVSPSDSDMGAALTAETQ